MPSESEYLNQPAAKRGWQTSGTLKTKTGTGGASGGNQSFTSQANFPEAGPYTVQFTIDADLSGNTVLPKVEALVKWSVDGNTIIRRISVASGTSISGVGEAVAIQIMDVSPAPVNPVPDQTYGVTVQYAPGTRPTDKTPPTLWPDDNQFTLSPANAHVFDVPQNVGVREVMVLVSTVHGPNRDPIPAQGIVVQHITTVGPAGSATLCQYDPRDYQWVPLAPGSAALNVSLASNATENVMVTVIYGIDG